MFVQNTILLFSKPNASEKIGRRNAVIAVLEIVRVIITTKAKLDVVDPKPADRALVGALVPFPPDGVIEAVPVRRYLKILTVLQIFALADEIALPHVS